MLFYLYGDILLCETSDIPFLGRGLFNGCFSRYTGVDLGGRDIVRGQT